MIGISRTSTQSGTKRNQMQQEFKGKLIYSEDLYKHEKNKDYIRKAHDQLSAENMFEDFKNFVEKKLPKEFIVEILRRKEKGKNDFVIKYKYSKDKDVEPITVELKRPVSHNKFYTTCQGFKNWANDKGLVVDKNIARESDTRQAANDSGPQPSTSDNVTRELPNDYDLYKLLDLLPTPQSSPSKRKESQGDSSPSAPPMDLEMSKRYQHSVPHSIVNGYPLYPMKKVSTLERTPETPTNDNDDVQPASIMGCLTNAYNNLGQLLGDAKKDVGQLAYNAAQNTAKGLGSALKDAGNYLDPSN